jgi:hypothetical protein
MAITTEDEHATAIPPPPKTSSGTPAPTASTPERVASPKLDSVPTTADAHTVESPTLPPPPTTSTGDPTAQSVSAPAPAPDALSAPTQRQDQPASPAETDDPRIATLRGMFPDFDSVIL